MDILIVEDEADLRLALAEGLSSGLDRCVVRSAANVDEAESLLEREEVPRLIISDVRMPGRSGLDFLLSVRDRWPEVRFVLMSAYNSPLEADVARARGVIQFLSKPFELSEVVALAQDTLSTERFTGQVDGITLTDLLQLLHFGRRTACIRIGFGRHEGQVYLQDGEIVHARTEGQAGPLAFRTMVAWQAGRFSTEPDVSAPVRTIDEPFNYLLMESLRVLDEIRAPRRDTAEESTATESDDTGSTPSMTYDEGMVEAMRIRGAVGVALVRSGDELCLAARALEDPDSFCRAAAAHAEVVRCECQLLAQLEVEDVPQEILMTLGKEYHLLILQEDLSQFVFAALRRERANLALARRRLREIVRQLDHDGP